MDNLMDNIIFRGTLFGLVCCLAGGCVTDNDDCPIIEETPKVTMEFTVTTRGAIAGSRAITEPSAPDGQLGTVDENYLDLRHISFLLFDDKQQLIVPLYPKVEPETGTNYKKYTVSCDLPYYTFDYAKDNAGTPTEKPSDNVTFTVVVLGNYFDNDPKRLNFTTGVKLDYMLNQNSSPTFGYPLSRATGHTEDKGWWPIKGDNGQYIPMSGLRRFTVARTALLSTTPANPLRLSDDGNEINMLRAVAKIEVIDCINKVDQTEPTPGTDTDQDAKKVVTGVTLNGFMSRGSIIPTADNFFRTGTDTDPVISETDYVTTTSIPSDAIYNDPLPYKIVDGGTAQRTNAKIDFFYDATATNLREDKCPVYSAYVPEYEYASVNATNVVSWLGVTISDKTSGAAGTGDVITGGNLFEVKLAPYNENNQPVGQLTVFRNNIYRYELQSVDNFKFTLKWTVCNMDQVTVTIPDFN